MNKLILRLTDKQLEALEKFADIRQCSEADIAVALIESLCQGFIIAQDAQAAIVDLMKHTRPGSGKVGEVAKGGRQALGPELVEVAKEFRATGLSYESVARELQAQGVACSRDSVRRALASS